MDTVASLVLIVALAGTLLSILTWQSYLHGALPLRVPVLGLGGAPAMSQSQALVMVAGIVAMGQVYAVPGGSLLLSIGWFGVAATSSELLRIRHNRTCRLLLEREADSRPISARNDPR